jgi:hypothetical protein
MKEPESWVGWPGWVQIEGTVSRDGYLNEGAGEWGGMGSIKLKGLCHETDILNEGAGE